MFAFHGNWKQRHILPSISTNRDQRRGLSSRGSSNSKEDERFKVFPSFACFFFFFFKYFPLVTRIRPIHPQQQLQQRYFRNQSRTSLIRSIGTVTFWRLHSKNFTRDRSENSHTIMMLWGYLRKWIYAPIYLFPFSFYFPSIYHAIEILIGKKKRNVFLEFFAETLFIALVSLEDEISWTLRPILSHYDIYHRMRRSSIRYKSLSVTRYIIPPSSRGEIAKGHTAVWNIQNCTLSNWRRISFRSRGGEEAATRSGKLEASFLGGRSRRSGGGDFCAAEDANRNALEIDKRVVVEAFYDRSPVPRVASPLRHALSYKDRLFPRTRVRTYPEMMDGTANLYQLFLSILHHS